MNIKIGILNVPKHGNKHDLIHFVTTLNECYPDRRKCASDAVTTGIHKAIKNEKKVIKANCNNVVSK